MPQTRIVNDRVGSKHKNTLLPLKTTLHLLQAGSEPLGATVCVGRNHSRLPDEDDKMLDRNCMCGGRGIQEDDEDEDDDFEEKEEERHCTRHKMCSYSTERQKA